MCKLLLSVSATCAQDCRVADLRGTVLLYDMYQYLGNLSEAVDIQPYTSPFVCAFPPLWTESSCKVAIEQLGGQRGYYLASEVGGMILRFRGLGFRGKMADTKSPAAKKRGKRV